MLQQTIRSRGGIHRCVRLRHAGVVVPNRTIDTISWSQYLLVLPGTTVGTPGVSTTSTRMSTWSTSSTRTGGTTGFCATLGSGARSSHQWAHPCCCVCYIIHFLGLRSQCYQGGMRSSQSSKSIAATRETPLVSVIAIILCAPSVSACSVFMPGCRGCNQS